MHIVSKKKTPTLTNQTNKQNKQTTAKQPCYTTTIIKLSIYVMSVNAQICHVIFVFAAIR